MVDTRRGRGLEGPVAGDILILPFPFRDLKTFKRRPAIVLKAVDQDVLLAQITSKMRIDEYAIALGPNDFAQGSLPLTSIIRPQYLFTIDRSMILRRAAHVTVSKFNEVILRTCEMLQEGVIPSHSPKST